MSDGYRQEVLNVLLAQLLQDRGTITAPERIIRMTPDLAARMPDVLVNFQGLRLAIEGEFDTGSASRVRALDSARRRVAQGIAHIGVAVTYPEALRRTGGFASLRPDLADAKLGMAIVDESEETDFILGTVGDLENVLRRALENLAREDVVKTAVEAIEESLSTFVFAVSGQLGTLGRILSTLGIRDDPETLLKEGKKLKPTAALSPNDALGRIAGLVVINAMIFQEALSPHVRGVKSLQEMSLGEQIIDELSRHWDYIIKEINYDSIFTIGRNILLDVTHDYYVVRGLQELARTAKVIVQRRAALSHDLMGRIYHRLLPEAKYLGTYYTSIPAATLLLKLALQPSAWGTPWHEMDKIRHFRIADLACGTGTLLMAAANAMVDNYIDSSVEHRRPIEVDDFHKYLSEEILYGYDVQTAACHLTASTLGLRAPQTTSKKTNLFLLPLGTEEHKLGSIEFLGKSPVSLEKDLFGASPTTQQRITGRGTYVDLIAPLPELDLCVMNPPFTRSVGDNLLFGSSPEQERRPMMKKLQELVRTLRAPASITAGLGAVFVATADPYIKPGGRIALVLPKALLSGVAWAKTRGLLVRKYKVNFIVASHDPERWNFSESTDLSEVLLVATKLKDPTEACTGDVVGVNLWKNPPSSFEALAIASRVTKNEPPTIAGGQGALEIFLGETKVGEALRIPWKELKGLPQWMLPCAFAQSDLIRAGHHLMNGNVWLPGYGVVGKMPLCPLGDLGTLGPDRRDIHDGFTLSPAVTPYAAFWGHKAPAMYTIAQKPNQYLSPRHKAIKGRNLRRVENLWPLAGRIMIAERLRLNTQRLLAVRISRLALSNVWWPFSLHPGRRKNLDEKVLCLWINSTFGFLLELSRREETQGPWIDFKKPVLDRMPVLNLSTLKAKQLKTLVAAYDRLASKELKPFPEMSDDSVRAEIDRAVASAFSLPDLSVLREMLAREPVVCMKPL